MLYYHVLPYILEFKRPAKTSRGTYTLRNVWYVFLSRMPLTRLDCKNYLKQPHLWGNQNVGIGEIAPLYDLSCDYNERFETTIHQLCQSCISEKGIDTEQLRNFPSILFGLETAWLSLNSKDGVTFFDTNFSSGKLAIKINGLVWMGTLEFMEQQMVEKIQQGFKCIKLKIGAHDFNDEYRLLKQIGEIAKDNHLQIRVDANGAYSEENVKMILEKLSKINIHSIEQPIKSGNIQLMSQLCQSSPTPIALDEELIGVNTYQRKHELLSSIRPQYIVLKPSLHGGITGVKEWIKIARSLGIRYWLTSALESNIGLNAIAQLTSTFNDTETWQGLGTGALFVENINNPRLILIGEELWHRP